MVSHHTLEYIAFSLNNLVCHPVVVVAGDERQQQPLESIGREVQVDDAILMFRLAV